MPVQRVTLQLRIARGIDLPKADLLSDIDPFIRVLLPPGEADEDAHAIYNAALSSGAQIIGAEFLQTRIFTDDPNAAWDEDFFLTVDVCEESQLEGCIRLEVFDKVTPTTC